MESWADAMTLLMAFFIMLFAFALVDETKFYDFRVGMVTALGVSDPVNERADDLLESGNGIALTVGLSTVPTEELRNQIDAQEETLKGEGEVDAENIEEVRQLLENKFTEIGVGELVDVSIDDRGVVIRFDGRVLFPSGSATLDDQSDPILAASAEVIRLVDNPIDIEGHTDNRPTGGRWISNWELSGARASSVVRWLLDNGAIVPSRLAAVGMADTRPRASNSTEDGRIQNRRVEVVVRVDGVPEDAIDPIDPIGDPIPGASELEPDSDGADSEGAVSETDGSGVGSGVDGPVPFEIDPNTSPADEDETAAQAADEES